MSPEALDGQIIAAHAAQDNLTLADLYQRAARLKLDLGDGEAAGFLMTQAFVYALDSGHSDASSIRAWLAADGRELNE